MKRRIYTIFLISIFILSGCADSKVEDNKGTSATVKFGERNDYYRCNKYTVFFDFGMSKTTGYEILGKMQEASIGDLVVTGAPCDRGSHGTIDAEEAYTEEDMAFDSEDSRAYKEYIDKTQDRSYCRDMNTSIVK